MRASISRQRKVVTWAAILVVTLTITSQAQTNGIKPINSAAGPVSTAASPAAPIVHAPSRFRLGEKLSYNISFGKFINAAYAEMSVVSRGTLSGRDAIELRSKIKTLELVNAAFFQWDETRSVFVAPDTGLPLFVTKRINNGLTPKETSVSYLKSGPAIFDFLSLIYKARDAGGVGTFTFFENEKSYTVTFQSTKSEHITTEAGEFDTLISDVTSDYLAANGIKQFSVDFSADENHVPVLFRMKTAKGEFRATLSAVQLPKTTVTLPGPLAAHSPTPAPAIRPKPTATPYVDNQPLAPELGFELGESLEYAISSGGVPVASITLEAKERRQIQNVDSLVLAATVTKVEPGTKAFVPGDFVHAYVDPETLAPRMLESRFNGEFTWLNQSVTFDRRTGSFSVNGGPSTEAPMGTHTLLSLIYAMRSFNLKPSKDPNNPVNDTRVAVFWENQPYIFTLRPGTDESIIVNGEKTAAQAVKVTTGNDVLDKAALRVWLSPNDRVPLRFAFGPYQADLVNIKKSW